MKLLELRRKMKKKKPEFVRQEAYRRKRISKSGWRAPKGMHSKMRRKMGGKRKQPSVGYSSPKAVRGLTRDGFKPFIVKTLKDLKQVKDEIIIIGKTVGLRKKLQLLEKIKELKLKVANIKDIEKFIKQAKENFEAKKKQKKEKQTKKVEAAKKKEEKPKEKKKETKKEKEKKAKEEKRKVLEQK